MQNLPRSFTFATQATLVVVACLCSFGCGRNPEGTYEGEIRDWVKWVFEGKLVDGGQEVSVELVLSLDAEANDGGRAEWTLSEKMVTGSWKMEGAKRRLIFDENVYILSKQGAFHVLRAKDFKLRNDDGSPLRLLLNKGRSTERGVMVSFTFEADGTVLFKNSTGLRHTGEWQNLDSEIVVRLEDSEKGEAHKFYFSWDDDDLLLRKLVILMGVGEKVGKDFGAPSRKSRSPKKVYDDPPRFSIH